MILFCNYYFYSYVIWKLTKFVKGSKKYILYYFFLIDIYKNIHLLIETKKTIFFSILYRYKYKFKTYHSFLRPPCRLQKMEYGSFTIQHSTRPTFIRQVEFLFTQKHIKVYFSCQIK